MIFAASSCSKDEMNKKILKASGSQPMKITKGMRLANLSMKIQELVLNGILA